MLYSCIIERHVYLINHEPVVAKHKLNNTESLRYHCPISKCGFILCLMWPITWQDGFQKTTGRECKYTIILAEISWLKVFGLYSADSTCGDSKVVKNEVYLLIRLQSFEVWGDVCKLLHGIKRVIRWLLKFI